MGENSFHEAGNRATSPVVLQRAKRDDDLAEIRAKIERERVVDLPFPEGMHFLSSAIYRLEEKYPEGNRAAIDEVVCLAVDRLLEKGHREKDVHNANILFRSALKALSEYFPIQEDQGDNLSPLLAERFLKAARLSAQGPFMYSAVHDLASFVKGKGKPPNDAGRYPQTVDLHAEACEAMAPYITIDDIGYFASAMSGFEAKYRPACQSAMKAFLQKSLKVDEGKAVGWWKTLLEDSSRNPPAYATYTDFVITYAEKVRTPDLVEKIMKASEGEFAKGSSFDQRLQTLWKEVAPSEERYFSVQRAYTEAQSEAVRKSENRLEL